MFSTWNQTMDAIDIYFPNSIEGFTLANIWEIQDYLYMTHCPRAKASNTMLNNTI